MTTNTGDAVSTPPVVEGVVTKTEFQQLSESFRELSESLKESMAGLVTVASLRESMASLVTVASMRESMAGLATKADVDEVKTKLKEAVKEIETRIDRQDQRLKAIEDFPRFPAAVRPATQFGATRSHATSNANRVRVGYAG